MDKSPFDHFVQLVPEESTRRSVVACADTAKCLFMPGGIPGAIYGMDVF
jgi:hypothetical protein